MANITFNVSPSVDNAKLLVKFTYDKNVVEQIKSLPWKYVGYGYHKPGDEDSDLYGYVDESTWFIDHDATAMEALENAIDTPIPSEYWPDGASPPTANKAPDSITASVNTDGTTFTVSPVTPRVQSLLDAALSYDIPDAHYSDAYQNGHWDGKEHLFDTNQNTTSIGHLGRVSDILEREGFEVIVDWEKKHQGRAIETEWHFPYQMRDYQREAVNATMESEGGIISLPTGTGKTVTALQFIHDVGRQAIILVHTRELLYQWADEVRESLNVEPGVIGDDNWSEGPVTIASMQTLMSRGLDDLSDEYGIAVFDECHRTSAADTMHDISMGITAHYRVGLSATPWRRTDGEELKIEGAIKETAHEVTAQDMIRAGYLANPVFDVVDPGDFGVSATPFPGETYQDAYRRCIELNPARLRAVAATALELRDAGHRVLVNVNRILQGEMIAWLLNPSVDLEHARSRLDDDDVDRRALLDNAMDSLDPFASTDTVMLSADVTGKDREQILEEFESGDRDILISTILKEGVDIPDISAIVLAHGQKSDLETIQTIGRALRPTGNHARIVDVADRGEYFRSAFRERLNTMTRYYELDLELSEDTVPIPAVPDDELSVAPIDRGALAQTDSETPGQKTLTDLP